MRKILIITVLCFSALGLCFSCSDEGLPENSGSQNGTQLHLKSVAVYNGKAGSGSAGSGTISEFSNGDTVGLYLSGYRSGNPFPYAVRGDYGWRLSEPVFPGDEPARLLAFYPYRRKEHASLSAKEVNVEHTSQTDYMYGQAEGEYVSRDKPYAGIVMKHALALVQFRFIKNGYPHGCSVQRVSIRNADGVTHLGGRGILNLESGEVEVLDGYGDEAAITPVNMNFHEPYTGEEEYARILTMPVGPVRKDGDLLFGFEIDGRSYSCPVKAGTAWQSGMKYTYGVEMAPGTKSSGASRIPGNISVELMRDGKKDGQQ